MTPRELDPGTILNRLRAMGELLDQLDRLRSAGLDPADYGVRLQVERILSAVVDLAVAINTHVAVVERRVAPRDMTASFRDAADVGMISDELATAIQPSVGMRNVVVHAYLDLDVDRMMAAVPLAAEQYRRYLAEVAGWLRDRVGR